LGGRNGIWPVKNMGMVRWALVSPDGVAPSRMVGVSASVIFPCTIKSRNSLLTPAHQGGHGKRAVKRLWQWWFVWFLANVNMLSPVRLSSVCLSSVTFVRPTQAVQIFGNISAALGTLAIH